MIGQHFVAQEARPAAVEAVAVDGLDPFLRGLLFTDGTVTRALGVQALEPVAVTVLTQARVEAPAEASRLLEVPVGAEAVERRVGIEIGAAPVPALWAESHLIPERLPEGFFGRLDGAPDGIGQSLQQGRFESRRELLWFGLDRAPAWVDSEIAVVRRLYRVVSGGRPAILISESFAVERLDGIYRLAALVPSAEGVR